MVALGLVNGKENLYFLIQSTVMWTGKITYGSRGYLNSLIQLKEAVTALASICLGFPLN